MIDRDEILSLIAEEKEIFSEYTQLCRNYQIMPDPIAVSRSQGRLDILQKILQEKNFI
jgi:hypothetical protein